MDTHGPSHTARGAALLRAAHLVVDDPPPIFLDPLALPLCGFHDTDTLHTHLTALQAEAAHVLGATHGAYLEYPYDPPSFVVETRDAMLAEPIRIGPDGTVALPQAPGLGIELDFDRIESVGTPI